MDMNPFLDHPLVNHYYQLYWWLVVDLKSLEKRCWGGKLSMMIPGSPQAYVFRIGG
jgi:hypothetical protein